MANLILAERYEILEKIGDGGMAVVFKARDRLLSRFVAVKVLRKEHIADTTFVNNFIREAKAAASLLHPNIVTIYDVGRDRDIYYIVMEYVEGRALSDVIAAEAPFDYKRVISIGKQMASALSLAHRNNIIHRDVKPHNILMTPDGTAKITDFGIAKAMGDGTIISESGVIMGSVHYFSPEQSRGQYVDEKSDIYSLGIVLYEMLTGRVPFDADNPVTIAVMHMNDSIIPPSRIVKGVPPGLDQIVLKATAKYQSDRFHDIDEMYRALDNVNYITGIIDDPEVAGFVMPAVIAADTPGRGSSSAAGEPKGLFPPEAYGSDSSKDRALAVVGSDGNDGNEEDEEEEKRGFFTRLFRGEIGTDEHGKLTRKWKVIAIIAAIIIAIAIVIPLSRGILGLGANKITVPSVIGMAQADAVAAIEKEGLKTNITTQEIAPEGLEILVPEGAAQPAAAAGAAAGTAGASGSSADAAAATASGGSAPTMWILPGQVLAQNPPAGSLMKKGSTVALTVATAAAKGSSPVVKPEMGVVPDVVGKKQDEAVAAIKAAGFRMGNVVTQASDQDPGIVIGQDPTANSDLEKDKIVSITVSTGPKLVAVPTVAGRSSEDAQTALTNAGFMIGNVTEEFSNDYASGQVTRTDPPAGTQVKEDTPINVFVSKGRGITVPNLVGTSLASAKAAAEGLGLAFSSSERDDDSVAAGTVLEQSIAVGTVVAQGTKIKVVVSRKSSVELPDFTGKTAADITAAGFTVGTVTQQDDASPTGTILRQSPAPGTQVLKGSVVNITVSNGNAPATPATPTEQPTTGTP